MNLKTFFCFAFTCLAMFSHAQEWLTDFDQAKSVAAKENKQIIMVFQGSDWCAPCIKLDHEVWSSEAFKAYAADHFIMVKVDFPRKKANALTPEQQEKNNQLAEAYNRKGFFPLVVVFDSRANRLGETGYKKLTPDEYIRHILSVK